MNYTQIRGYIDAHLVGVDQQTAILEQSNRPEIKQVAADEQYQQRTMNEALSKGETARYDLIPEKNYRTGIMGKIAEIRSALGF
jgi:Fe-S cluster assembly ATPase SufC